MLLLSRKEGESIILNLPNGDQVRICLTQYNGVQTKVGIDAPPNVQILREELIGNRNNNR